MKSLLITGVSTGIGFSATEYLLDKGYFVFGSVRKGEDANRLMEKFPENFHPLVFDVRDRESIGRAASEVERVLKGRNLYALINNAGVARFGPIMHLDEEKMREAMEVNMMGVFRVTQLFLPLLGVDASRTGQAGRIIQIGSVSGRMGFPFLGPYCSSKFALEGFTDVLRREMLTYNIPVSIIVSANLSTPIWEKAKEDRETYEGTAYEKLWINKDKILNGIIEKARPLHLMNSLIEKILQAKRPKPRYYLTANTFAFRLATTIIPARWIDSQVKKNLKKGDKFRDL